MAVQGKSSDTGTPVSVSPTRPTRANLAASEKIAPDSYGESGFAQASSVTPNQGRVVSGLGLELEATVNDPVMAAIRNHKGKGAADAVGGWQTRTVDSSGIKPAGNMRNRKGE